MSILLFFFYNALESCRASLQRSSSDFGKLSVISVYLPSGSSGEERQQAKFRFLDLFYPQMLALRAEGREIVLCGDWNIAHQAIDDGRLRFALSHYAGHAWPE